MFQPILDTSSIRIWPSISDFQIENKITVAGIFEYNLGACPRIEKQLNLSQKQQLSVFTLPLSQHVVIYNNYCNLTNNSASLLILYYVHVVIKSREVSLCRSRSKKVQQNSISDNCFQVIFLICFQMSTNVTCIPTSFSSKGQNAYHPRTLFFPDHQYLQLAQANYCQ